MPGAVAGSVAEIEAAAPRGGPQGRKVARGHPGSPDPVSLADFTNGQLGAGLGAQGTERERRSWSSRSECRFVLLLLLTFLPPDLHKCLGISRHLQVLAQCGLGLARGRPSPVYLPFVACAPTSLGS